MNWLTVKFAACFGGLVLLAVELPIDPWLQLGLAGLALFVLFWVVTRTGPAILREERKNTREALDSVLASHRASNDKLCCKLDEVRDAVIEGNKERLDFLQNSRSGAAAR